VEAKGTAETYKSYEYHRAHHLPPNGPEKELKLFRAIQCIIHHPREALIQIFSEFIPLFEVSTRQMSVTEKDR